MWRAEGALIHHPERQAIADSHDDHAMHWGAFHQGQLVGAARLCLHQQLSDAPDAEMFVGSNIPAPVASLNRLVVLSRLRGLGIAALLDQVRIDHAKQSGARAIIVTPTDALSRRRSLGSRGFQFLAGVVGHPIWSPSVMVCACYLILDPRSMPKTPLAEIVHTSHLACKAWI